MRYAILLFILLLAIAGCAQTDQLFDQDLSGDHATDSVAPFLPGKDLAEAPPAKPTTVVELQDGDSFDLDAEIIEKTIDGHPYRMYGYNGMVPGPLLKLPQNATITVHFTNKIDRPTTVHWHGLRHDNRYDGVPGVTQDPIEPGQSFTYQVRTPDEGMFWYHPHVREDLEQDAGLYANLLVTPTDPDLWNRVDKEEMLMLDDVLLQDGEWMPYGESHANFALMGRFGNKMLVNGETDYHLKVKKGEVVRFYLTDVANARPFNITFPGAEMKLVGSDLGLLQRDRLVDSVTIHPAERYIVEVLFDKEGEVRMTHNTPGKTRTLGTITVGPGTLDEKKAAAFNTERWVLPVRRDIAHYERFFKKAIDYELDLTIEMPEGMMMDHGTMTDEDDQTGADVIPMDDHDEEMMDHSMMDADVEESDDHGEEMMMHDEQRGSDQMEGGHQMGGAPQSIEWEDDMKAMNQMASSEDIRWIIRDKATGKENMDLAMHAKVGDVLKIKINNLATSAHPMQHPIHLHGQRFLVLDENGDPMDKNLGWKDTAVIPAGESRILLVDVTNPGDWMMHCHIAEHLTADMMTHLIVDPQ